LQYEDDFEDEDMDDFDEDDEDFDEDDEVSLVQLALASRLLGRLASVQCDFS
jgi:hypothetical protein